MPERVPSVGRIVHYVSYGTPGGEYPSVCRAAIITQVDPDSVSLCVLSPDGMFFNHHVRYDVDAAPGTWHWPDLV